MESREYVLQGRKVTVCTEGSACHLIIMPADEHTMNDLSQLVAHISQQGAAPFALCAFEVQDWNRELSPWDAPAVFGDEPFGHGAADTLKYIENVVIPFLRDEGTGDMPLVLGGYSLAGLFSLWCGYESSAFDAICAASPSVWYPGWKEFADSHKFKAGRCYLSLGDREHKTGNKTLKTVAERITEQYELLCRELPPCDVCLEWNEGNHFRDVTQRMSKGFAWSIDHA